MCGDWRRALKIPRSALLVMLLVVLLLSWPVGCTTTVVPPARLTDPVTVYLLDHGHTPSLIVPTPDGELVRYAFGDLRYYGRGERSLLTGAAALLAPTAGGLGRAVFAGPPTPERVLATVPVYVEHFYAFAVEREAAYDLHAKLEARYHERLGTALANPAAGLHFVNAGRSYTWFYNSNHAVADWLRELACDVRGPTFMSSWRIAPPEADEAEAAR